MPKSNKRHLLQAKKRMNLSQLIDIKSVLTMIKPRRLPVRAGVFRAIKELSEDPHRHFYITRDTKIEDDFCMDGSSDSESSAAESVYYADIVKSGQAKKWNCLRRNPFVCVLSEANEPDIDNNESDIYLELVIASTRLFMSSDAFFNYESARKDECLLVFSISITMAETGAKNIEILDRCLNKNICHHYNMKAVSLKIFSDLRPIINMNTTIENDAQHIATAKWMATSNREMFDIVRTSRPDSNGRIKSRIFNDINAISLFAYQTNYFHQQIRRANNSTIMHAYYSAGRYINIWENDD